MFQTSILHIPKQHIYSIWGWKVTSFSLSAHCVARSLFGAQLTLADGILLATPTHPADGALKSPGLHSWIQYLKAFGRGLALDHSVCQWVMATPPCATKSVTPTKLLLLIAYAACVSLSFCVIFICDFVLHFIFIYGGRRQISFLKAIGWILAAHIGIAPCDMISQTSFNCASSK